MDQTTLMSRKVELLQFLSVFDKTRANQAYIDGLFQHNDFATIRRLLKTVYNQRLPAGWDTLSDDGVGRVPGPAGGMAQPQQSFKMETANPSFQSGSVAPSTPTTVTNAWNIDMTPRRALTSDPTSSVGAVALMFGVVMAICAIIAAFGPFWAIIGAAVTPYGERTVAGASIWLVGYTLAGPPSSIPPIYITDCTAGQGSITIGGVTVACGAMLATQIFSIFTIVACIACGVLGIIPGNVLKPFMSFVGLAVAGFAIICFGVYFLSALRFVAFGAKALCANAKATPATCDADETGPAFWMMVSLAPFGLLHAFIARWRFTVYSQLTRGDGRVYGIDDMNGQLKKVILALGSVSFAALIAGIVLAVTDSQSISSQISTSSNVGLESCSSVVTSKGVLSALTDFSARKRRAGLLAPLCAARESLENQPQFFPIGDVNKDGFPDFIAIPTIPNTFTSSTAFLVWGQDPNLDFFPVDFDDESQSTRYLMLTISSTDPQTADLRPVDAKLLGDVSGDGFDDFLLIYVDISGFSPGVVNDPVNGFRAVTVNDLFRTAYEIHGRSNWGTSESAGVGSLYSLVVVTPALPPSIEAEFPYSPYFGRISIGADLDGDGLKDWCTTTYSTEQLPSYTFGFCVYGRSGNAQLILATTIGTNNNTSSGVVSDSSLGFGLVFPSGNCLGAKCYYDLYTSKSIVGSSLVDDFIVTNHFASTNVDKNIYMTDGGPRVMFGAAFGPVASATKTVTATLILGPIGKITEIVPLGDIGAGSPTFAASYADSLGMGTQGFSFITMTPTTAPSLELVRFPRLSVPLNSSSSGGVSYVRIRGGAVVPSATFDYDADGKPDVLLMAADDEASFKVVLNRQSALFTSNTTTAASGAAFSSTSLSLSEYRDIVIEAEGVTTSICGKGELCLNFASVIPSMILFSTGGAATATSCGSAATTPSVLYMTSAGTRIAFGIFGFITVVTLVLACLFAANKQMSTSISRQQGSTGVLAPAQPTFSPSPVKPATPFIDV